ncbi:unnamed protein product, partial [Prorocentrum cordatum]
RHVSSPTWSRKAWRVPADVDDACLFSPDTPDLTQAWDSSSRAAAERVALQCERTREGGRGGEGRGGWKEEEATRKKKPGQE